MNKNYPYDEAMDQAVEAFAKINRHHQDMLRQALLSHIEKLGNMISETEIGYEKLWKVVENEKDSAA